MLYQQRPPQVEAIQFTGDNGEDVVEFASTEGACAVAWTGEQLLLVAGGYGLTPVPEGAWVLRPAGTTRYEVCSDAEFRRRYEPAADATVW